VWLYLYLVVDVWSRKIVAWDIAEREEACQWAAAFVEWYVHEHRHSGQAVAICQKRTLVYEQARQRHPRRWSRSVRCWQQPDVVWINEPPDDTTAEEELLFLQAA
jgi:hypothetical protein